MDVVTLAGLVGLAGVVLVWRWALQRRRRQLACRLVAHAREAERRARENCRPLANVTYLGHVDHDQP